MKHLKIALLVCLGILFFSACEKDDICIDGDTPLLVIRFYDRDDTTLVKAVPSLVVRGLDGTSELDVIANASSDSIAIPLRVDQGSTSFLLSQNPTEDDTTLNSDTITFDYETQEIFISRACGFVVNYDSLSGTTVADDSLWIREIRIDSTFIENSNSAHVKILH